MAVPKKRTSRSIRGKRRAHDHLKAPNRTACEKCGEPLVPHRVCMSCGYYKGKKVFEVDL